ncbi:unnamed protein product [Coregonus sp. 'balchen']|nr:unnamed protein product [Coregonus sp. 'balchen']
MASAQERRRVEGSENDIHQSDNEEIDGRVAMGSMFRSEEVCLVQIFLQSGSAYNCVSELGELGLVEFRDLNPNVNSFQRKFVGEVRRCEELEKTFSFLEQEINRSLWPPLNGPLPPPCPTPSAPQPRELITIEEESERLARELKEVSRNRDSLRAQMTELSQYKGVLTKTHSLTASQVRTTPPRPTPPPPYRSELHHPDPLPHHLTGQNYTTQTHSLTASQVRTTPPRLTPSLPHRSELHHPDSLPHRLTGQNYTTQTHSPTTLQVRTTPPRPTPSPPHRSELHHPDPLPHCLTGQNYSTQTHSLTASQVRTTPPRLTPPPPYRSELHHPDPLPHHLTGQNYTTQTHSLTASQVRTIPPRLTPSLPHRSELHHPDSLPHRLTGQNYTTQTHSLTTSQGPPPPLETVGIVEPNRQDVHLSFVAGVVHPWKVPSFERLLWRACRGYIIVDFREMEEQLEHPDTGEMQWTVFLISYWGDQIGQKVKKICDCFHTHTFAYPDSPTEREEILQGLQGRIEDIKSVLSQTEHYLQQLLVRAVAVLPQWKVRVQKCKAVQAVLNLCSPSVTDKCLIAEAWCPVSKLPELQSALREGGRKSGSGVDSFYNRLPCSTPPPTLFPTNSFTAGFQSIVEAYGVASYREVNPAVYTIITFPFLFAVMFGDVGHGLLMFLAALWMVLEEKDPKLRNNTNEIWRMMFGGRYLILLMGLFSIYTGAIYNECFSRGLSPFSSGWHVRAMFEEGVWK